VAVQVRGDPEQRSIAKQLAQELVSDDTAEHFVVGDNQVVAFSCLLLLVSCFLLLTCDLPHVSRDRRQASALIGSRGKTIRELEAATGARLQVITKQHPSTAKTGVRNLGQIIRCARD
jgi:hypothetical protein